MVKVLYVADMLHTKSGITAVMMNYYRHFDKSNVRIDFLLPENSSEQRLVDEVESCGSNVYYMPVLGASFEKVRRFKAFIATFFATHNDYVAVHSHFMQLNALVFPVAKRNGIGCCISHSHLTKYSENKLHCIRNWFMCLPNNKVADVWAACGIKAGEFLYGRKFLSSPKHMIVRNAIELDRFSFDEETRRAVRSELGIGGSEVVLGTVGRLQKQKNQEFLLNVMKELVSKGSRNYKLVIAGEGPLEAPLKERSKALSLDNNVVFTGRRADAYRLYQAFDVFLLPSIYEGLPVVGVEAQVSGLPCVFSTGITNEIGLTRSIFLPVDEGPAPWVNAIEAIENVDLKDRVSSCEVMQKAGFDINVEAKRLEDFYLGLQQPKRTKA